MRRNAAGFDGGFISQEIEEQRPRNLRGAAPLQITAPGKYPAYPS